MPSLWNASERAELLQRIDSLRAEGKPQWGTMSCKEMLAHLCDSMRMALGELQVKPKSGPMQMKAVRHAIIYWLPFPKGAPTAPELIKRKPQGWKQEADDLKDLIQRLADHANWTSWPPHPIFGDLSGQDWGVLSYKHIDHHLKQFGA
ncbi:MAG: DUF1569 domain-containing protein [Blastocatellia bacterium]|nr:DUF1569 domain-containing protein [Blastocatellia bacterium]